MPNVAPRLRGPAKGVPIDAIIFGGRTRDREPLVRAITDLAEGVYDGLTLGAEATFAAEGVEGVLRYDPMSMRPFMSYARGRLRRSTGSNDHRRGQGAADLRPRELVPARPDDGRFLWPGYRENLRALLWLVQLKNGEVKGRRDPGRRHPDQGRARTSTGLEIDADDLDTLLTIDVERWQQEMGLREEHLEQFDGLPEAIWEAHRRVAKALDEE